MRKRGDLVIKGDKRALTTKPLVYNIISTRTEGEKRRSHEPSGRKQRRRIIIVGHEIVVEHLNDKGQVQAIEYPINEKKTKRVCFSDGIAKRIVDKTK